MSEENKAVVRRFFAALGKGDVAALEKLVTPECVAICTGTSLLSGRRDAAQILAAAGMLGSMTQGGIDFEILSLTAEDGRVSCEAHGRSVLANGRRYDNEYHFLLYIENGRVIRMKEYLDTLLVQSELVPLLAAAQPA